MASETSKMSSPRLIVVLRVMLLCSAAGTLGQLLGAEEGMTPTVTVNLLLSHGKSRGHLYPSRSHA
jgi:uncharacterized membrane protein YccC